MSEEFILEFEFAGRYVHPQRKWRMGLSQDDHKWLTDILGLRAKKRETWDDDRGMWMYLGARIIKGTQYERGAPTRYVIRMLFRNKSHAALFKLARLGQI